MAAITSTIVALGGVALSAGQAIKASKDKKKADAAALKAQAAMRNVKEENAFKGMQVPTLGYDLAQEAQAQRDVSAISALQGAGAAGVIGGIGKVAQSGQQADLKLAAQAGQAQYQRDMAQAQAGQGIEQRRANREFGIEAGNMQNQMMRSAEASSTMNQAAQGIFSGLLGAAGSAQLAGQAMGMGAGAGAGDSAGLRTGGGASFDPHGAKIPGGPGGRNRMSFLDYLKNIGSIQNTTAAYSAGNND